jgi:rhomboid protease GluP
METRDGVDFATGPWEAFALRTLAPLGPLSQVHLAPKIPPVALNRALRTYLSLQGDELLLALIDSGTGTLDGCCALTTRRIYWTALDAEEPGSRLPASPVAELRSLRVMPTGLKRASDRKWRYHVLRYGELPKTIDALAGTGRFTVLNLGSARPLALHAADRRLSEALARYLETMGAAARSGVIPSSSEGEEELARRVEQVLPAVVRVTAQTRAHYRELLEFRRALFAATPRIFSSYLLILACVGVFGAMVATGVPALWPTSEQLIAWGANAGARVMLRHEYWRLPASVFVHAGLIHLAVNMWCLINIGPLVERLYGNFAFAVLYLAAGTGGAIASLAVSPVRVSVGASGAIFGVLGALLAFLIIHRHSIPPSLLKPLRASAIGFVVFNTIFGLVVPNIDQGAHMGGLATGFASGALLCGPWPVTASGWLALRRCALSAVIAAALAGAGWAAVRRGEKIIPPMVRYNDIVAQVGPAMDEFDALLRSVPDPLALGRERVTPEARLARQQVIQDLIERGTNNLSRLRRAQTSDPEIAGMVAALCRAQSKLINWLRAAHRFLDVDSHDGREGPQGIVAAKVDTQRSIDEFDKLLKAFLRKHQLRPVRPPGVANGDRP